MITITIMVTVTASKWNLERKKKKKSENGLGLNFCGNLKKKITKMIVRLTFERGRKEEKSLTNKQTRKILKSKENSLTNKQSKF